MSINKTIPSTAFSDLEKVLSEITDLQKEQLSLLMDLIETKYKLIEMRFLAQIEKRIYSGINKYFK